MIPRIMAFVLACLILVSPSIAVAQFQEAWANRHGRPGTWTDVPGDMAIDGEGNVYVTGSLGISDAWDISTVKYAADGTLLWATTYNGPAGSFDAGRAIGIDAAGNVYVTGESVASWDTGFDYVTIKYDPHGNQLWIARFDGPGHSSDFARALAIDASGSIYVTGDSVAEDGRANYATVKYDGHGTQHWVAYYDGPAHGSDVARALVLDVAGNVYVTGQSAGVTGTDFATVKYDAGGHEVWAARYTEQVGEPALDALDIAVDAAGCVYITGAAGTVDARAYATVKYDPDGIELWAARFSPPNSTGARARALALDADANVYVTGSFFEQATDFDWATIKYDTHGQEQWISRYNGPANAGDSAFDIAVDPAGNAYVAGSNYTIIKYGGTDGTPLVVEQYNGSAGGAGRDATEIRVDAADNVYVTGTVFESATGLDWLTIKYGQICAPPQQHYTLSVTKAGIGRGKVTSQPEGIVCGTDCDESYVSGTTVTLTATPQLGSLFNGWQGCDAANGKSCTVTVDRARSVTANFLGIPLSVGRLKP
jgi:hypothetical protein